MFTHAVEEKYFKEHLNKTHKVLEWGSGLSTPEISTQVDFLVSIEHNTEWYEKIKSLLSGGNITNCKYLLRPPNPEGIGEIGDGENLYVNFKNYVDSPIDEGPFDIILIDGRARVSCASKCHLLGHKDTIVFIHDFTLTDRSYYMKSLEYLEHIETTMTMAKFKIKNL